eukprot:6192811-Pleurochrysis_carterae.AAC.4
MRKTLDRNQLAVGATTTKRAVESANVEPTTPAAPAAPAACLSIPEPIERPLRRQPLAYLTAASVRQQLAASHTIIIDTGWLH